MANNNEKLGIEEYDQLRSNKLVELKEEAKAIWLSKLLRPKNMDFADLFAILMMGRDMGIKPTIALSEFYIIKGRVGMSARFMLSRVKQFYPEAEYYVKELNADRCTYAGRINKSMEWSYFTYTMDMAKRSGDYSKAGDMYRKRPVQMLLARAITLMCSALFPEVRLGVAKYTPEELMTFDEEELDNRNEHELLKEADSFFEEFGVIEDDGADEPIKRTKEEKDQMIIQQLGKLKNNLFDKSTIFILVKNLGKKTEKAIKVRSLKVSGNILKEIGDDFWFPLSQIISQYETEDKDVIIIKTTRDYAKRNKNIIEA